MKSDVLEDLFVKMTPYGIYCTFRNQEDFSVVTTEDIEGPLPLNSTAAKILSLCDGSRTVLDIYEALKNEYTDVDDDKLFFDTTICIRNFEVIKAIEVKYA